MRARPGKGGNMFGVKWGEQTAAAIAAAAEKNALVLLPLGCTEQHAHHLPVDTDTYQVERLTVEGAKQAALRYKTLVLVMPTLPYGPASEHAGLPGTIGLKNEIYIQIVKQLLLSAIDQGFRRLAAVRGCGGHFAIPGAMWDLKAEAERSGHDVVLRVLNVDEGWSAAQEEIYPGTDGGHAAVMETALCMAERAQLVDESRMRAPQLNSLWERYKAGGETFLFSEISDTGALGDPTPATPTGGKRLWEKIIAAFADKLHFLEEQDRQLGRL